MGGSSNNMYGSPSAQPLTGGFRLSSDTSDLRALTSSPLAAPRSPGYAYQRDSRLPLPRNEYNYEFGHPGGYRTTQWRKESPYGASPLRPNPSKPSQLNLADERHFLEAEVDILRAELDTLRTAESETLKHIRSEPGYGLQSHYNVRVSPNFKDSLRRQRLLETTRQSEYLSPANKPRSVPDLTNATKIADTPPTISEIIEQQKAKFLTKGFPEDIDTVIANASRPHSHPTATTAPYTSSAPQRTTRKEVPQPLAQSLQSAPRVEHAASTVPVVAPPAVKAQAVAAKPQQQKPTPTQAVVTASSTQNAAVVTAESKKAEKVEATSVEAEKVTKSSKAKSAWKKSRGALAGVRAMTRMKLQVVPKQVHETQALAKFLNDHMMFSHLNYDQKKTINETMSAADFKKDAVIYDIGAPATSLFFIKSGKVRLVNQSLETIITLGEGQCFGELALVSDRARAVKALAEVETSLWELPQSIFYLLTDKDKK
eukprot:GFYU01018011.1.p1 GENE.GFYU01018011.1~~GFYU01018011.1.p1  ORF type:complete len:485 (+),score=133.46 GFYU01018011.1:227-1681(+)